MLLDRTTIGSGRGQGWLRPFLSKDQQTMSEENEVICPCCSEAVPEELLVKWAARRAGQGASEAKARAARENGKKGGRPPKKKSR